MPYYEDGVYYLYYLKDGADSYQHSIFLVTTTDFVTYTEVQESILTSSEDGQDAWIGTGSVCKVGDTWYLTYSAQDDTLWYASSQNRYGPYSGAKRLEGKLFFSPL